MDVRSTRLDSGVRLVTEVMPSVRSVALGVWVTVGSRDETADEHGCSHFLEHLLFKGSAGHTARQLAEAFDAIGGELNAFTARELTCFHAQVLDRDLPMAVGHLGDLVATATNASDDVEAERQVVLSELDIHHDTPDDLAHADALTLVLGDHPLARETLGTHEGIAGMRRDTIQTFYERWYRPANVVVTAAGHLDHDETARIVGDALGDLGRPGGAPPPRVAPGTDVAGGVAVRTRPGEQVHVVLGGRGVAADDPRRHALRVLDVALGGGLSSRLFQEVRERRGLAYSVYSHVASYTDVGTWVVYAGVAPQRLEEALDVLHAELDRVAATLDDEEVARAKGALAGGTVMSLEHPAARMSGLGRGTIATGEVVDLDARLARIEGVTLEQVREVASELLGAPRHLAVVGPVDDGADLRAA